MFIHSVLFEIAPRELSKYRRDCRMWAAYAAKAKGFIRYLSVQRLGLLEAQPRPSGQRLDYKNQYASVYEWKEKNFHDAFMKKHHDWLVSKSQAKVKVLGYYNLKTIQDIQG